jgi:hypothetical protein
MNGVGLSANAHNLRANLVGFGTMERFDSLRKGFEGSIWTALGTLFVRIRRTVQSQAIGILFHESKQSAEESHNGQNDYIFGSDSEWRPGGSAPK